MKNTMLYMLLLAFGLMSSCAKEEIPTPENEPTTPEIAYTEGELLVKQHSGQDDGDHDAELIDWNDL